MTPLRERILDVVHSALVGIVLGVVAMVVLSVLLGGIGMYAGPARTVARLIVLGGGLITAVVAGRSHYRRTFLGMDAATGGRCARCGYDLRMSECRCPECGEFVPLPLQRRDRP